MDVSNDIPKIQAEIKLLNSNLAKVEKQIAEYIDEINSDESVNTLDTELNQLLIKKRQLLIKNKNFLTKIQKLLTKIIQSKTKNIRLLTELNQARSELNQLLTENGMCRESLNDDKNDIINGIEQIEKNNRNSRSSSPIQARKRKRFPKIKRYRGTRKPSDQKIY